MKNASPAKIVILASGSGTNAEKIIEHFKSISDVEVSLIISNKEDAGVLERAKYHGVESVVFNNTAFKSDNLVLNRIRQEDPALIVLAGFLLLVPKSIIREYPEQIVNIHPSLLPQYGGKGMYGKHVHQAVIDNEEKESGITIHFVNEEFDKGKIIFQAKCEISASDTADTLAEKIHALEHQYFPSVIESLLIK